MEYALVFAILYPLIAVIWVIGLVLYNVVIGGFDFGALGHFAWKSAVLIAVVCGVMLVPYGGWLVLAIWWLGFVFLFGMDFWEARILVVIIWVLTFLTRLAVMTVLA